MPEKAAGPEKAARSVAIGAGTDVVLSFLSDVETLPLWASFYQRRLGREDGGVRFATPIGESLTHLETEHSPNGGQVTIVSAFAARVERASIARGLSVPLTVDIEDS